MIFWFHDVQVPAFFPDYGAPELHWAFCLDEILWEIEMVHTYLAIWERWKKKVFLRHLWHEKGDVSSRSVAWIHWDIVMQCLFTVIDLNKTQLFSHGLFKILVCCFHIYFVTGIIRCTDRLYRNMHMYTEKKKQLRHF